MASEQHPILESLGLGGDGDEIDAICDVEKEFGVGLDYSNCQSWRTVGDVYASLQLALIGQPGTDEDKWHRFTMAISQATGVDPSRIAPTTLLLGKPWPTVYTYLTGAALGLAILAWRLWSSP